MYLGWFGPRGIGSILYAYTVLRAEEIAEADLIFRVIMITIFISVLAHGISAVPLTNWYAKRIPQLEKDGFTQAETKLVPGMPTRNTTSITDSSPSKAADT